MEKMSAKTYENNLLELLKQKKKFRGALSLIQKSLPPNTVENSSSVYRPRISHPTTF